MMLNLFRRKKQEVPTWRQWYAIPTREAKAPEWIEWLRKQNRGIEGDFSRREESPLWILDPDTFGAEGMGPVLAECRGVASLRMACEASRTVFLTFAQLAFGFAVREAGVVANMPAMRLYRADDWLPKLKEFRPLDHYTAHQVREGGKPQWLHSHGLIQFDIPEVEVREVPPALVEKASGFIDMMREWMMHGERFGDGHTIGSPGDPEIWAVAEYIRAEDNEGHGEPDCRLLRFSDYDREAEEKRVGLTRYLSHFSLDEAGK